MRRAHSSLWLTFILPASLLALVSCERLSNQDTVQIVNFQKTGTNRSSDANQISTGNQKQTTLEFEFNNLPPILGAVQDVSIQVIGRNLTGYIFDITQKESCSDAVLSDVKPADQPIQKQLESGKYLLCVKGVGANGAQSPVKSYAWEIDSSLPSVTVAAQSGLVNYGPYFESPVQAQNAEKYKYKIVLGSLEPKDCEEDGYSDEISVSEPISQRLFNDGQYTVCLLGISRAKLVQPFPNVLTFKQDAMLPAVSLTLESGANLPSIVNTEPLKLTLSSLNLATEYSYALSMGQKSCYELTDSDFNAAAQFDKSNEASVTLSSDVLKEGLNETTKRVLRWLCIKSFKQGANNTKRSYMNTFAFNVDSSKVLINETGVTGIPANPTVNDSFKVKITPVASTIASGEFNPATSKIYIKIEKLDSKAKIKDECVFTGIQPIDYGIQSLREIEISNRREQGLHRLCLMLENSAGTKSKALSTLVWQKEDVVATLPVTADRLNSIPQLRGVVARDATLARVPTANVSAKQDKQKFKFKYKHIKGSIECDTQGYTDLPEKAGSPITISNLEPMASKHTLCVLASQYSESNELIAFQKVPSRFEWFRDGTAPDHEISGLPQGISNDTKFEKVGIKAKPEGQTYNATSDAVKIFTTEILVDSTECPKNLNDREIYKEDNLTNGTKEFSLEKALTSVNNKSKLLFCSFSQDGSGNRSGVKSVGWTFDTRPFANPTFTPNIPANSASNVKSVRMILPNDPDFVGYKSVLRTDAGCGKDESIYPETPNHRIADPKSLDFTFTISGVDGPRTICVLAVSKDGNEVQLIDEPSKLTWIRDTVPTKIKLANVPAASLNAASTSVKIAVGSEDLKDPASAYDFVLVQTTTCPTTGYSAKMALKEPLTLTSTVPAGQTIKFTLCVRGYDAAGNVGPPVITSWSQTAPK